MTETSPAAPRRSFQASLSRLLVRTLGRTSDGIRMSFEHGLTSGKMLDYVYRNRPSGRWLIGPAIDRIYLSAPGWRAVRTRRRNLETLLLEAIAGLRAEGRDVSILDVASGPGSYILNVLEQAGPRGVTARARDLDARWIGEGAAEARHRGIANVRFETGDAFDREGILALRPRPNLAVSSGFYDWITDDELVRRSIGILFEALEPGGRFVTTNQAAHPNLEFVSAVFTDFNHAPLRMKMRPAATIESWLTERGFVIERTLADPNGYFTVTRALKP